MIITGGEMASGGRFKCCRSLIMGRIVIYSPAWLSLIVCVCVELGWHHHQQRQQQHHLIVDKATNEFSALERREFQPGCRLEHCRRAELIVSIV